TILGLESALSGKPVDPEWVKKVALWKTGLFRIVVMGEIKKGKSSFVNALLGHKDLVPVCSDVATSTIFKICHGDKVGYKVFFHKTSGKAPVEIDAAQLFAYGTEDGNPGNEKQVEFIQVFCPSPILKSGLVVIDTPGLGGLFKQHKRITYEYVPKADAVFLVTDSVESPIGQAEIDLLADLKKVTKHIFFVQTKSRLVDADAREARKANNLSILASQSGFEKDKIKYFVVDSQTKFAADEEKDLKKLDRSGFKDVAEFVNGYIRPNVHRLLMVRAMAELRPRIDSVARELDAQDAILRSKTESDRTKLANELQEQQHRVEQWEKTGKSEVKDKIESGLYEIKKSALARINRFRPQGEIWQEIEVRLDEINSLSGMQECVDGIQSNLSAILSEELHDICSTAQQDSCQLLSELSHCVGKDLQSIEEDIPEPMTLSVSQVRQKLAVGSAFNTGRTVLYGGLAGATIASVVGGVIGSVVPVVGTFLGSMTGGLLAAAWGGYSAYSDQHEQQLEAAKAKAKGAISGWLSSCHADMVACFSDQFEKLRRHIMHEIENGAKALREETASRIAELKQLGQRTNEEIAAKLNELKKRRNLFSQSIKDMGLGQSDESGN
ncbi:MAG: dynamin family protein, partial [Kiritimatiellae bacterium]|nr:dynamin family protein [Kiritimatiellia bacterium]